VLKWFVVGGIAAKVFFRLQFCDQSGTMDEIYTPETIEAGARQYWDEQQSFRVTEDPGREKYYCLSMFPYPS